MECMGINHVEERINLDKTAKNRQLKKESIRENILLVTLCESVHINLVNVLWVYYGPWRSSSLLGSGFSPFLPQWK